MKKAILTLLLLITTNFSAHAAIIEPSVMSASVYSAVTKVIVSDRQLSDYFILGMAVSFTDNEVEVVLIDVVGETGCKRINYKWLTSNMGLTTGAEKSKETDIVCPVIPWGQ